MTWKKMKLGDVLTNREGRYKPNDKSIANLKRIDKINFSGQIFLSDKSSNTDMILIKKGDLVISGINVEKGAITVYEGEEDITATIHYSSYVFNTDKIDIEFLKVFLRSPDFVQLLKAQVPGGIKTEIKPKHILPLEVYFPDSTIKQRAIAKHFFEKEKMFNDLDNHLTFQLTQIENLNQAILQEAVQGKLVNQDKKDEPASELLKRIKGVKAESGRKEKQLPPITKEEIPYRIPESWIWCRLGEICDFITKGTTPNTSTLTRQGDIPYLKVYNIVNQKIDFEYKPQFIDTETHKNLLTRSIVFPGDVLMNIVGPPLGKIAIVPATYSQWNINQALAIFRPIEIEINVFLYYYLCEGTEVFKLRTLGVVGQDNLSLEQCRNLLFPLPPLLEQKRIVGEIKKQLAINERLKAHVIANQVATEQLLKALLHQAFEVRETEVAETEENILALAAEPEVAYKKAKVVPLYPTQEKEENHFVKRKVLATYIINQSLDDPHFGDVKFEKLLHLSDYFAIKRNLGQKFYKKVAGPLDNAFTTQYFNQIEQSKWFNRKKVGRQFFFSAGTNHSKSLKTYDYFSNEELEKVNKIISYFKKSDYEKPEIVSTLYAVWNNRLIKNEPISDAALITDFYEWDEAKKKYSEERLIKAIQWMKAENFIPDGWGSYIDKPKAKKK